MPLQSRQLGTALLKKGFEKTESSHHTYYHFWHGGVETEVYTYLSRGHNKDLPKAVAGEIKKQLKLNTAIQLERLAKCPMSQDDYIEHLRAIGIIPPEGDEM